MLSIGAEGERRTPTPLPELDPEPSVSTNSTTSARKSVYRIRPPLASFFFDFSHFFILTNKIGMIKGSAHRLPETVAPPAGRGNATLAALRTADEMAAVRGTAPQAGTGDVRPCTMTGSAPSGGCRLFGRYAGSAGWRRTRTDGTCPPLAQAADFSQTGGPAKAGKTQGTHMRSTAPQPSRPAFYPVPALRHGENGISFRPQPRKQPLSGCSPSRAAAALATLSPISPAAATGASGAWR